MIINTVFQMRAWLALIALFVAYEAVHGKPCFGRYCFNYCPENTILVTSGGSMLCLPVGHGNEFDSESVEDSTTALPRNTNSTLVPIT